MSKELTTHLCLVFRLGMIEIALPLLHMHAQYVECVRVRACVRTFSQLFRKYF